MEGTPLQLPTLAAIEGTGALSGRHRRSMPRPGRRAEDLYGQSPGPGLRRAPMAPGTTRPAFVAADRGTSVQWDASVRSPWSVEKQ
jgi:hypothetical protein